VARPPSTEKPQKTFTWWLGHQVKKTAPNQINSRKLNLFRPTWWLGHQVESKASITIKKICQIFFMCYY